MIYYILTKFVLKMFALMLNYEPVIAPIKKFKVKVKFLVVITSKEYSSDNVTGALHTEGRILNMNSWLCASALFIFSLRLGK